MQEQDHDKSLVFFRSSVLDKLGKNIKIKKKESCLDALSERGNLLFVHFVHNLSKCCVHGRKPAKDTNASSNMENALPIALPIIRRRNSRVRSPNTI